MGRDQGLTYKQGFILVMATLLVMTLAVAIALYLPVPATASGGTSGNCEVYATVEGEDRYACDDFVRGYTCYDRANGMTFCVLMTEEYK